MFLIVFISTALKTTFIPWLSKMLNQYFYEYCPISTH